VYSLRGNKAFQGTQQLGTMVLPHHADGKWAWEWLRAAVPWPGLPRLIGRNRALEIWIMY
jgi:hypothetical protein